MLLQLFRASIGVSLFVLHSVIYLTFHFAIDLTTQGQDISNKEGWLKFLAYGVWHYAKYDFVSYWPLLLGYPIAAEIFQWRTIWISILAAFALLSVSLPIVAGGYEFGLALVVIILGISSGTAYWYIAGRHAGLWKRPLA
jgi:hypothetical protein